MKLLGEEEVDVPAIVVDYNKKVVFDLTATVEKIRRWLKLRIPQKFSKKM